MNRGPFIFIGVFAIISLSWAFTLIKPIEEVGDLSAVVDGNVRIPPLMSGLAAQGREVYQAQGCVHCHTQQVRVVSGSDVERGWGDRQTVALDYLGQSPVFTGIVRMGPDLANVGTRRPEREWHLLHLFDPQITSPNSNMPPFRYLFETRQVVGQRSNRALDLPSGFEVADGYEVVPKPEAEALAAYMLSLKLDQAIEEAPTPEKINYAIPE